MVAIEIPKHVVMQLKAVLDNICYEVAYIIAAAKKCFTYLQLEILKWARENGCDWDTRTCCSAALNGHLEIIKWARENSCDWDSSTCICAANSRHIEIIKWARENGC